jgi:hypothetical protein
MSYVAAKLCDFEIPYEQGAPVAKRRRHARPRLFEQQPTEVTEIAERQTPNAKPFLCYLPYLLLKNGPGQLTSCGRLKPP